MTQARDRLARWLLLTLGIASIGAFANAAIELRAVAPDRLPVETWRMLAFLVFAGLFMLLAYLPRRMTGVWELVFFHKASVPLLLAYVIRAHASANASFTDASIIGVDAALAATVFLCYLLTQGWRAWLTQDSAA